MGVCVCLLLSPSSCWLLWAWEQGVRMGVSGEAGERPSPQELAVPSASGLLGEAVLGWDGPQGLLGLTVGHGHGGGARGAIKWPFCAFPRPFLSGM